MLTGTMLTGTMLTGTMLTGTMLTGTMLTGFPTVPSNPSALLSWGCGLDGLSAALIDPGFIG